MGRLGDEVRAFFDERGWEYSEGDGVLALTDAVAPVEWSCYAEIREDDEQFIFYSVAPFAVPDRSRPAVMDYITRANYGLSVGNFELDLSDGELRFKTSIDVEGDRLSRALVRQVVLANIGLMGRYLPGVVVLLGTDDQPAEVIARIEA